MSSCSFIFPGYADRIEFSRARRGQRVYFLTSALYDSALQDPSIILDAAYLESPEHHIFLRTIGISAPPLAENILRRRNLEFVLIRHGFRQTTDPLSWTLRLSQMITSRLLERLPGLVEFFPSVTSKHLFDLIFGVFLDLGLPSKVENQYQDKSNLIYTHIYTTY